MESVGSQENWWPAAEEQTLNEIVQGLDWLSDEAFQKGAKVVWVYPPVQKIFTNQEPINDQSVPYYSFLNWQFEWLDDIYAANGVASEWDGAYELANQLRRTYSTNWAVEIAVVMDQNDADHKFSDGYFAYSSSYQDNSPGRSPIVVMTYNNDGWGPNWMDEVVSHEVSHLFGASDEYWDQDFPAHDCDTLADCGHHRSYLQTNNGNCEFCNPNSVSCYMRREYRSVCTFTPPELGWRDQWLSGNGVMDPVDQNSASFMWISPVTAGDRITIVSLGGQLMNVLSVSPDMLVGTNNNVILWDGVMYNDALAPIALYPVSKNGSDLETFFLNVSNPTTYTIPNHSFQLDVITYRNVNAALCIRHTVYDSLGNIYSRPRFDVMTNANTWFNVPILGYEDGIYTSVVYGHRSDGLQTNVSSITFINYICGDTNNDGLVTISDIELFIALLYMGSEMPPVHPASGDVNCSGDITIGDISILIDYLFISGAPLNCCHHLT